MLFCSFYQCFLNWFTGMILGVENSSVWVATLSVKVIWRLIFTYSLFLGIKWNACIDKPLNGVMCIFCNIIYSLLITQKAACNACIFNMGCDTVVIILNVVNTCNTALSIVGWACTGVLFWRTITLALSAMPSARVRPAAPEPITRTSAVWFIYICTCYDIRPNMESAFFKYHGDNADRLYLHNIKTYVYFTPIFKLWLILR